MGTCFLHGNGGSGVNLRVVGGTVRPAGAENLIWVNTETVITNWIVSQKQPENPENGMVWIQSVTENRINILRKNALEIFPTHCKEYSQNEWKPVAAFLFRQGEWLQFSDTWNGELYDLGDTIPKITGGWGYHDLGYTDSYGFQDAQLGEDSIIVSAGTLLCTAKTIDFRQYTRLKIIAEDLSKIYLVLAITSAAIKHNIMNGGHLAQLSMSSSGEYSMDITNVDEGIVFVYGAYDSSSRVKKIWME